MAALVKAWIGDIAFVLGRLERLNASGLSGSFEGRLDLNRVGIVGHSLGGATAAQFCRVDSRCKAGIDVDGAPIGDMTGEIPSAFMFLLSDHSDASDPESRKVKADIQSIYDGLPENKRLLVEIRGANHFAFSDDGALLKSNLVQRPLRTLGFSGLDGRRQLAVTAYCVRSFFDSYLKPAMVAPPPLSSPSYPEIHILK